MFLLFTNNNKKPFWIEKIFYILLFVTICDFSRIKSFFDILENDKLLIII